MHPFLSRQLFAAAERDGRVRVHATVLGRVEEDRRPPHFAIVVGDRIPLADRRLLLQRGETQAGEAIDATAEVQHFAVRERSNLVVRASQAGETGAVGTDARADVDDFAVGRDLEQAAVPATACRADVVDEVAVRHAVDLERRLRVAGARPELVRVIPDHPRLAVEDHMAIEWRGGLASDGRIRVIEVEEGRVRGPRAVHVLDARDRPGEARRQ